MQSDHMPKIPQAARMTAFHAGADARGDAALAQAIATAAPVPTTEAQANELTQRWGVWSYLTSEWITHGGHEHFNHEEAQSIASLYPPNCEVRPYPTPPPTPPASSGGEWHCQDERLGAYPYTVGKTSPMFRGDKPDDMRWLRNRLNAADAMERALKEMLANLEGPGNLTWPQAAELARAALRK